jgi:hypothetical protein
MNNPYNLAKRDGRPPQRRQFCAQGDTFGGKVTRVAQKVTVRAEKRHDERAKVTESGFLPQDTVRSVNLISNQCEL